MEFFRSRNQLFIGISSRFIHSSIGCVIWSQLRRCWRRCWSLTLTLALVLTLVLTLALALVLTLVLTLALALALALALTLTLNTNSTLDLFCEGTNINFICRRSEEANHRTLILCGRGLRVLTLDLRELTIRH